jgi:hypothetical protein
LARVQDALVLATPGSSIWVAPGVYTESFVVPSGVRLMGGLLPGAQREDEARPLENPTILDALGLGRVVLLGERAELDGFVVRNGRAPAPGGGGTLVDGTTVAIRRCQFLSNTIVAGDGTGLLVLRGGDPTVVDCVFAQNANTGHAIAVQNFGRGTYEHLSVVDNQHNGMFLENGASCVIRSSIFARNRGRGICDFSNGAPNQLLLQNALFWQNTVSLMHYRGVELRSLAEVSALPYASGILAADPRFAGVGDYRLLADSPAIDRGGVALDTRLELAGFPRVLDGDLDGALRSDVGAYEFGAFSLRRSGAAIPGTTLRFELAGPTNALGVLAVLQPSTALWIEPLGALYGLPLAVLPLGSLPASLLAPLPIGVSFDLHVQGVGLLGSAAGFSNPLALAWR